MKMESYRYVYPPRPKHACHPKELSKYDDGEHLAQVKVNGSCMVVFTNGQETIIMNRHRQKFNDCKIKDQIKSLHRGKGWMILVGEYTNKAKRSEEGNIWRDKLVLFDIIAYEGNQLIGMSFEERYDLLRSLYNSKYENWWLDRINEDVLIAKALENNFQKTFEQVTKVDLYEGYVLKNKKLALQPGHSEDNNCGSMIKFRKPSKNYRF